MTFAPLLLADPSPCLRLLVLEKLLKRHHHCAGSVARRHARTHLIEYRFISPYPLPFPIWPCFGLLSGNCNPWLDSNPQPGCPVGGFLVTHNGLVIFVVEVTRRVLSIGIQLPSVQLRVKTTCG